MSPPTFRHHHTGGDIVVPSTTVGTPTIINPHHYHAPPMFEDELQLTKSLAVELLNDPTLSAPVKRQISELGKAYTVQLKKLAGRERIERLRVMLALGLPGDDRDNPIDLDPPAPPAPSAPATGTTAAADVSCSSSSAASPAAKPTTRQKRKRKSYVFGGTDVLLPEHVECALECARIAAANDGPSSYAIEEMD